MSWIDRKHDKSINEALGLQWAEHSKIIDNKFLNGSSLKNVVYNLNGLSTDCHIIEIEYLSCDSDCSDYFKHRYFLARKMNLSGKLIKLSRLSSDFMSRNNLYPQVNENFLKSSYFFNKDPYKDYIPDRYLIEKYNLPEDCEIDIAKSGFCDDYFGRINLVFSKYLSDIPPIEICFSIAGVYSDNDMEHVLIIV